MLWHKNTEIPKNDEVVVWVRAKNGKPSAECGRYNVFNDRFSGSCFSERFEAVEWCYLMDILRKVNKYDKAFNAIQKSINIFETTKDTNEIYAILKTILKELKI